MSGCTVSITGTATGATCISYSNCNTTCCSKTLTSCLGTPTYYSCPDHTTQSQCTADKCCTWYLPPGHPANCRHKGCPGLPAGTCEDCGCTASGACTVKTCAQVAAGDNNPDVCSGCSTCGGDWIITDSRGDTPWSITVTGTLDLRSGGRVDISGGDILSVGDWDLETGGYLGWETGGILAIG